MWQPGRGLDHLKSAMATAANLETSIGTGQEDESGSKNKKPILNSHLWLRMQLMVRVMTF